MKMVDTTIAAAINRCFHDRILTKPDLKLEGKRKEMGGDTYPGRLMAGLEHCADRWQQAGN